MGLRISVGLETFLTFFQSVLGDLSRASEELIACFEGLVEMLRVVCVLLGFRVLDAKRVLWFGFSAKALRGLGVLSHPCA